MCVIVIRLLPSSEEEHVKNDIVALRNAIEEEDTITTFSYIDESYNDKDFGEPEELKKAIHDFFADFDSINIGMSAMKVNIDSVDAQNTTYASCVVGLKVFAHSEGQTVILYGGIVKPTPAQIYLKKSGKHYKIYRAEY